MAGFLPRCHAPGTARPSAKLIPGACEGLGPEPLSGPRKVASPKVQSARSRPYEAFWGLRRLGTCQAQPADWLPSSFAVYQRPPPSSPPALIPRLACSISTRVAQEEGGES